MGILQVLEANDIQLTGLKDETVVDLFKALPDDDLERIKTSLQREIDENAQLDKYVHLALKFVSAVIKAGVL